MKKWAYPLLIAFVAFFIFSNPGRAGVQGRAFVIWLGDLAGATTEFLEGLFNDENDPTELPSGSGSGPGSGPGTPSDVDPGGNPLDPNNDRFDTMAPLGVVLLS